MDLVVFGIILIIIAVAFAVPFLWYGERRVTDADALVLAAAILSLGMGALNLAFLLGAAALERLPQGMELPAYGLLLGLAPVAAGALGLYVVRSRTQGLTRYVVLALAAALVLAGLPAYFAFIFAVIAAASAAVLFLGGCVSPRRLFQALDPRIK